MKTFKYNGKYYTAIPAKDSDSVADCEGCPGATGRTQCDHITELAVEVGLRHCCEHNISTDACAPKSIKYTEVDPLYADMIKVRDGTA